MSPVSFVPAAPFCLSARHQTCRLCEHCCPAQRGRTEGEETKPGCLQCGLCAALCPVRALPPGSDNNALLAWAEQAAPHALRVLCPHARAQAKDAGAVRLRHCPAALYAEVVLAIRAMGVTSLDLHCGDCAACPLGATAGQRLDVVVTATEALLPRYLQIARVPAEEQGTPAATTAQVRVYWVDSTPVSRRAFFQALRGRAGGSSSWRLGSKLSLLPPALASGQVSEPQGTLGRVMALNALRTLLAQGIVRAEQEVPPALVPCFVVRIGQDCVGCGLCAKICPTGALRVTETAQEAQTLLSITCELGLCSGCGQCRDLCRESALGVGKQEIITVEQCLAPAQLLWSRPVRHCTRCHSPFTTSGSLCPVCSGRLGM